MSDAALRRTVRRCTALLLVPLSSVPIVFVTWIEERGAAHYAGIGTVLSDLAWVVLVAAVLYLLGSAIVGLRETLAVSEDGDGTSSGAAD
jgi:succinate dehydrogenase hydrophobic anchor subunit